VKTIKPFAYLDHPYIPITDTASFTAYNESAFACKTQIELIEFINKMGKISIRVVICSYDSRNSVLYEVA
jgi:DNA adenine methylase